VKLRIERKYVQAMGNEFPDATGHDIKGLSKLVAKFCQHKKVKPTLDVFKRCSIFRGMDLEKPVENAQG